MAGMTERDVQHLIYKAYMRGGSHVAAIPNSCLYGWEADMITVTRARLVHEYEIKVSRSDFLREIKAVKSAAEIEVDEWGLRTKSTKEHRHVVLRGGIEIPEEKPWLNRTMKRRPNRFWFVCAEGICSEAEIPPYAGLMIVRELPAFQDVPARLALREVRAAPRLHGEKLGADAAFRLAGHACYRFWDHVFPNQEVTASGP